MRKRLKVHGIVQGVGFRPWVYHLALQHGLAGFVQNSTMGVVIEVEGAADQVAGFLTEFRAQPPVLAQIDEIEEEALAPLGEVGFAIQASVNEPGEFVLVSPDIATCPDCLADLRDRTNRRFGYPFTNCTNCGPRYSIIQDIPYDRPKTTMARFAMCAECEREYHDPGDRRFHAQPNACPTCGPWVELWDKEKCLARGAEAVEWTRRLLREGRILAIKGLGGFHLACDATNEEAVGRLRVGKRRSDKPFALMAAGLDRVEEFCEVEEADRAALSGLRRPIVLLAAKQGSAIASQVAPGNRSLGVMLPYTPLHHLLFDGGTFVALVMTSANVSEEPIAYRNQEVGERLHPLADYFLVHNRDIETRVDDSVVRTFRGKERLLRRSRGYAPQPIDLHRPVEQILACGGELKNTLCLTKDHYAILSPHIGDMENAETLALWEETLGHMRRFFRIEPKAVAHDLHPQYLTTRLALAMEGVEKVGVQHHHAHVVSCMADNRLQDPVIGVVFDGTGYGTDGKIWGGEFLIADELGFERAAHFRYVPLAGGDAAIRQPWRSAAAYLRDCGLAEEPFLEGVEEQRRRVVATMLERQVNTIETSSCGRLFDAVAAILNVRFEANYEGQAAIELEALAGENVEEAYPFDLDGEVVDFRESIRQVARDVREPGLASARFHNTVAAAVLAVCERIRKRTRLGKVCLSGGTFQNQYLLGRTVRLLERAEFVVFLQTQVPPNDGGLSLGQALIADAWLRR